MDKVMVSSDRCKQCKYCSLHCPKQAIEFSSELNEVGFYYPIVDVGKCSGCGICYITCPDGVFEIKSGEGVK